jgi:hypothetical protein
VSFDESRLNVRLELPRHMRCHSEFHVSKLREWIAPNHHFPNRDSTKPLVPAVPRDGHEEYEVEKVLDSRVKYGRREYLIKWEDARGVFDKLYGREGVIRKFTFTVEGFEGVCGESGSGKVRPE